MRSCEGLSRYSMLKISFRIGPIALSTLARDDLICMSSVNFEPIIKYPMFLSVEHDWKILQNG